MSEELGSGFFLAMHDLEIRGAGEVLGDNQSGERCRKLASTCSPKCSTAPWRI